MKSFVRVASSFLGAAVVVTQLAGVSTAATAPIQGPSSSFEQPMPVTPVQKEIQRLFQQISTKAAVAGKHGEKLESFTRVASRLQYQTHASELMAARDAINAMGSDFGQLEELRSAALPWQQSVIDRMEPVLAGLAGHATQAIERLNEDRRQLPSSQAYRDAVGNLSASASQIRTLISVNLDYAQARAKLDRLDASAAEPVLSTTREAARVSPKAAKSLEQRLHSELLKLPYYGVFDHLAFQVEGDQVQLSGAVSWPALKGDAENAVRRVEGVGGVSSDIQVLSLSPHDNRIRRATYWAVYGHSALARYRLNPNPPIRIIVANGNVTLKGVVASEMDKTIAYLRASGVPGVFSVTNDLRVGS
ncbi:MAG TPA: BON domain-containing protein [Candidatus Sulfotelmatobacter sp.]|nr:BON domain-containing protein [Candidatus Sulfotelmatobacter sp.]